MQKKQDNYYQGAYKPEDISCFIHEDLKLLICWIIPNIWNDESWVLAFLETSSGYC